MKSAQSGARIYDAGSLNLARDRRILFMTRCRSHGRYKVRYIFSESDADVPRQYNDVSKPLAPVDPISRSAKLFQAMPVALGLSRITHGTHSARARQAVDSISISDHIARSAHPKKSLGDLTCNPTPPSGWL